MLSTKAVCEGSNDGDCFKACFCVVSGIELLVHFLWTRALGSMVGLIVFMFAGMFLWEKAQSRTSSNNDISWIIVVHTCHKAEKHQ